MTPEMCFAMGLLLACKACCARKKKVCNVVGGMGNGLVEAKTSLRGEEAVAIVTWPFCRSFLKSYTDSDGAVSILLVPVQDVDVVFCCLHDDVCRFDFFDSALRLVGLSAGNLGNQIFQGLWRAWLVGVQPFQISSDEFGPASWGSVCGLNKADETWRGMIKRSFDESKPSGGDKVIKWEGLCVSPDTEVGASTLRCWSG